MNKDSYYILGMSPGNSYFKDDEVEYLITTSVEKYERVAVMIADVPAISTYIAYGYKENRARRDKAIPQGNLLKNRVRRVMDKYGYSEDQVHILDWAQDIEQNEEYKESYEKVRSMFDINKDFQTDARETTREVLLGSGRKIDSIESSIDTAVHYLLSEIAFLEWAAKYFGVSEVVYMYHKNWPVYENYIAGKYDEEVRKHMNFLLKENPWETYISYWGAEEAPEQVLRVGFTNYPPALMVDKETGNKSGLFYDFITKLADKYGYKLEWVEYVGYGVVTEGLQKNRFDVFASPLWEIPERTGEVVFSEPLYDSEVFIWKRKDEEITSESRIVVKEDDVQHSLAKSEYPNNRYVYVPQLSDTDEMLSFVAQGKGEITFAEQATFNLLSTDEQASLEKLSPEPLRIFNNSFAFNVNSKELLKIFNTEINLNKEKQ